MIKFLDKIIKYGILLLVFLIPWPARWIISVGKINGGPWEYGTQSVYVTEILLAAILVLVIGKWIVEAAAAWRLGKKKETPQRGRLYKWALLLFLIYAGVSVFWSIDKNTALIHWRWLVEAGVVMLLIGLFVETRYVASHEKKETPGMASVQEKIQWAIIISAVIQAGWGVGQWLMQSIPASTILGMAQQSADVLGASVVETLDGRWLRAYGSFPHPNMLGGWLVLGLVTIMALWRDKKFRVSSFEFREIFLCGSFTVILFGLLTTFSRSAWLAFGVCFIFWFIREVSKCHSGLDPESRNKKRNWIPAFAGMTLIGLIVSIFIVLFPQPFLTRLNNTSRLEYKSTSERQASLSEGWEIIKRHPLLGVGVGNYGLAVHRDVDSTKPSYYYQPTHNVFLLVWAELGLIGILLLTLNFLLFTLSLWRNKTWQIGGLFLLPLFVIAMLDHYLWSLYSGLMIGAVYLANISRK